MLYREIIAVCSQIHTKHINTLCGQNAELLNVNWRCINLHAMNTYNAVGLQFLAFLTSAVHGGTRPDRFSRRERAPRYALWALKPVWILYAPTEKQTSPVQSVVTEHQLESSSMPRIQQMATSATPLYKQLMPMTSQINMSLNDIWNLTKQNSLH
jgi:hypothetical protein